MVTSRFQFSVRALTIRREVVLSVVFPCCCYKCQVDVSQVVVDCPSTTLTSGDCHVSTECRLQVTLEPWILMAADHNTRVVSPKEQQSRVISDLIIVVYPIFEG